jgi:hypothetical protein
MRSTLHLLFFLLLIANFQAIFHPSPTPPALATSFVPGEHLTYKVHYGWLDAGIVNMVVDKELHTIHGNTCYKIDVAGESKGLLYLFLKMKNHFSSYLDTTQLIPRLFYRDIHEGTYRKNERVIFDHINKQVQVEELNDTGTEVTKKDVFNIGDQVQDIVSTWYVFRNTDFSQVQVGDILHSPVFFDNVLYERFQTKFLGKKKIKTKLGRINSIVVAPLVPFSSTGKSIFAGENSVELYLSDDENRIPLKIKVKLLVGAVEIDITNYQGTRVPLAVKE